MLADSLTHRQFIPLYWVQFLGALNDNIFKNALVMSITFRLANSPEQAGLLITAAAGLFILPFFLFSAMAGQISDCYVKTRVIRKLKLIEMWVMATGALAFWYESMALMFLVLFLMGSQSAFFGPLKYAILPEVLSQKVLNRGNAWLSGSTFVAILLGTLVGGWGVLLAEGTLWISLLVITVAVLGYVASLLMPMTQVADSAVEINANFICSTAKLVKQAKTYTRGLHAVWAISWFWFIGAVYLSQMPVMVQQYLADQPSAENWVLIYLTVFSVGIAMGAAWSAKADKGLVLDSAHLQSGWAGVRLAPVWLLGMSTLMLVCNALVQTQWAQLPYALGAALWGVALLGGRYIVPFYGLMQLGSAPHFRARMVAVNNILNALLMVISALVIMAVYAFGWDWVDLMYGVALFNLLFALGLNKYIKRGAYESV